FYCDSFTMNFFSTATTNTKIHTLSLHDALPILSRQHTVGYSAQQATQEYRDRGDVFRLRVRVFFTDTYSSSTYAQTATQKDSKRSEEHTSELQSRGQLVCRHQLEKKKQNLFI